MNGYSTVMASDVSERDGLGLELYDPGLRLVAEVFRDDTAGTGTSVQGTTLKRPPLKGRSTSKWRWSRVAIVRVP